MIRVYQTPVPSTKPTNSRASNERVDAPTDIPSESLTDTPTDTPTDDLTDAHTGASSTDRPRHVEMDDDPPNPSTTSTVRSRPKRNIKLPSRFKNYVLT